MDEHARPHHRPPTNEIDSFARNIEEEADFLAEHSDAAKRWSISAGLKVASGDMLDLKMVVGGLAS